MSFNINQPVISETAAAKANKIGDDFTNPATWRQRMDVPSTMDAQRGARVGMAGILFDGTTSGSMLVARTPGQTTGAAAFTVRCQFAVPTSMAAQSRALIFVTSSLTAGNTAGAFGVFLGADSTLQVILYGATTSDYRIYVLTGFQTTYSGTIVDVVVTRSGATVTIYVNGSAVTPNIESTGGTPPAWSDAVAGGVVLVGARGASSYVWNSAIYKTAIWSIAMSGAEVASLLSGTFYTAPWIDLDLTLGAGYDAPNRQSGAFTGIGGVGFSHLMPVRTGLRCVTLALGHADISSSAATTKVLTLSPNCGILRVEFDRTTAFDGGVTLDVGTNVNATRFVAAQAVSATGIVLVTSADQASLHNANAIVIYVKKSGATTVGAVTLRVVYEIRG